MDGSKLVSVKKALLHELSCDHVNALRVRELCRDNPGLIATAGLRTRIWSLLLLGDVEIRDTEKAEVPDRSCMEQQVLEADVRRTRGDVEAFRSLEYQRSLTEILQAFCLKHNIQYKQGMNEVLAPFIQVNPPPSGTRLTSCLFEAFLFRYLERFFCRDESSFLFKGFRLFHILLMYVDPQLGEHLAEQNFPPELYAPQWFLTVYARGLPMNLVLRLWDMLIAVDDPAFNFFIGLCMLRKHRAYLIMSDVDAIPEIISGIQIKNEADADQLVIDALSLYRLTPRCFLRAIRLCMVSSTQLAPKPMTGPVKKSRSPTRSKKTKWTQHDETMAKQAVRNCVILSANELVSKLVPVHDRKHPKSIVKSSGRHSLKTQTSIGSLSSQLSGVSASGRGANELSSPETSPRAAGLGEDVLLSPLSEHSGGGSPTAKRVKDCPDSPTSEITRSSPSSSCGGNYYIEDKGDTASTVDPNDQIVLIDLRTEEDAEVNGGGIIAKAIRLDPDCINNTEALSRWLQHFDGIKGCVICVIDMPPVQAPEIALWRRLLLGEGDGFTPGAISYGVDDMDVMDVSQRQRDFESPFAQLEQATAKDDSHRPGMRFVMELQKNGFPYVSLLDGGFPSLVEALFSLRGTVEPIIIQHNVEAWQYYLRVSGRGQVILPLARPLDPSSDEESMSDKKSNKGSCSGSSVKALSFSERKTFPIKRIKDMDELERAKTAYRVALSLKHERMAAILKIKISGISEDMQCDSPLAT